MASTRTNRVRQSSTYDDRWEVVPNSGRVRLRLGSCSERRTNRVSAIQGDTRICRRCGAEIEKKAKFIAKYVQLR
jgi:hypothetical protein